MPQNSHGKKVCARQTAPNSYEFVSGHEELEARLNREKVLVIEIDTGDEFWIHVVESEIVILDSGSQGIPGTIAWTAIEKARCGHENYVRLSGSARLDLLLKGQIDIRHPAFQSCFA